MSNSDSAWRVVSRYPSVERLCERHEGLVRHFGRAYSRRGTAYLDSWDLQQELRLAMVDVWSRHAHRAAPEVDRIVQAAMRQTVWRLFAKQRQTDLEEGEGMVLASFDLRRAEAGDAVVRLFAAELDRELAVSLSAISRAVLAELVRPPSSLHAAMVQAAERGGFVPVARYFARRFRLRPWTLRCALVEIRPAVANFLEIPPKKLRLTYLYR